MAGPRATQVSPKLSRAFDEGPAADDIVFRVRPPTDSNGIQGSLELWSALHKVETEDTLMQTKNVSSVCGFEIWYENESFDFVFTVPNEAENEHYRRQLAGHFNGIAIDYLVDTDEKFVSIDEGEYVAATALSLNKHFFEPIGDPLSGDGDVDYDPYQTILNEADTKDDTKMVIQFLYKPARAGWTRLRWNDVNQYAEQLEENGTSNPRRFGLLSDTVDNPQARQTGASNIRARANKPGFFVEARILVAHPDKAAAERQLDTLTNLFNTTYRSSTEQSLVADPPSNTARFLADMIRREPERMQLPSGLSGYLSTQWSGCSDIMVMTIDEIAGLIHIPSESEVTVDGIDWVDTPVKGTLPPYAEKFTPVPPADVIEALPDDGLRYVAQHEPDLLHEFDELVTEEHTAIDPIDPDDLIDREAADATSEVSD